MAMEPPKYGEERPLKGPRRLNLRLRHLNRTLLSLTVPALLENFLFSLVVISDTLIVGWLRSEDFLAVAALTGVATFFFNAPFVALAIGTASITSRSWGEENYEAARCNAGIALSISLLLSGAVVAVFLFFSYELLRLLGATPEVAAVGIDYLRILLLSLFFGQSLIVSNGILRSTGSVIPALWITGAMNIVNIVTSIGLAFGILLPKLGFEGVAWGTVISRIVGLAVSLGVLASVHGMELRPRHLVRFTAGRLKRLWHLTHPALTERLLNTATYMFFIRLVAHLGTTVLAGHQIALQVETFAFMPAWGLAVAVTTVTGQAIGAGLEHIAEIAVRRILLVSAGFMLALSVVFALFGPAIVHVFGATDEVLDLAGLALRISAIELPFMAFTFIFMGALRGAGDTRTYLYVSITSITVVRVGAVLLLAYGLGLGLAGVWLATALDWFTRSVWLFFAFRKGVWKVLHHKEKARFGEF